MPIGRIKKIESIFAPFLIALLIGGTCSQERVKSMEENNIGTEYYQRKLYAQAIEHLNRAITLDDTNEQAHYNLAQVYIATKQWPDAARHLQKAIALHEKPNPMYEYKLGFVLFEMREYETSKEHLEKAIEADPKLFKAHYRLAKIYEKLDQPENALRKYTDAIMANPRFIEAYRDLGSLYADLGFLDHAIQVFQSALKVALEDSEEEAQIRHALGTVYSEKGMYNEAIEQFRRALEIKPAMLEALFSLGWAYKSKGDNNNAKQYLERFVRSAGDGVPPHFVQAAQDALFEIGENPTP